MSYEELLKPMLKELRREETEYYGESDFVDNSIDKHLKYVNNTVNIVDKYVDKSYKNSQE